ncbi:MAG: hypothetical protein PHC53_02640 [Patescibacteria group bacterium]|nr:hypothetical protein [Patescibacteria group bacterium]
MAKEIAQLDENRNKTMLSVDADGTPHNIRSGFTSMLAKTAANLLGFLNTIGYAFYNATPTTRTDGQGGPLEADANGNLNINSSTKLAGEDLTNDVMKVEPQASYVNISASALVKTGAGRLFGFIVNSCAAGATIKIWDNTSGATTVLLNTMTFTTAVAEGPKVVALPAAAKFGVGCYVTIAVAAADITVLYN